MKTDAQIESVKTAPAVGGTLATIYGKLHELDWTMLAAQATVFYIMLQAAYLIWKWRREANGNG